jgi:hypothetical protein
MPVALKFDIIKEIVSHGARSYPEVADPSTSELLSKAGVALVTTYIEQLSLVEITKNPTPMFGANGGMWIGYEITEKAKTLLNSDDALRDAVQDLIHEKTSEVSQSVRDLIEECKTKNINENYKVDFLQTLKEIAICFDNDCFIASIGLCGKILEVCLKEILIRNKVTFDPNAMVGSLIQKIRDKVPNEYVDPSLMNVTNIINTSRITSVHAKEKIPIPSRDQAIMVIFATREVVRRNLSNYL